MRKNHKRLGLDWGSIGARFQVLSFTNRAIGLSFRRRLTLTWLRWTFQKLRLRNSVNSNRIGWSFRSWNSVDNKSSVLYPVGGFLLGPKFQLIELNIGKLIFVSGASITASRLGYLIESGLLGLGCFCCRAYIQPNYLQASDGSRNLGFEIPGRKYRRGISNEHEIIRFIPNRMML